LQKADNLIRKGWEDMRTRVEIPDELMREAKAQAAQEGVRLRDLIERGLRLVLAERRHAGRLRVSFPLLRSTRPGVLSAEAVRAAEEEIAQLEDVLRAGSA